MKITKYVAGLSLLLSQFSYATSLNSQNSQLIIDLPSGEYAILNVNPNDTFSEVMLKASNLINEASSNISETEIDQNMFFVNGHEKSLKLSVAKSSSGTPRNYEAKVSSKEKEDIAYIVTTLGRSSLKKLLSEKSSLKKAGNRVDHVHPLRFMACIFKDEELKVGILQIKERGGWVAKEFFSGLYDGLSEESSLNNIKPEYVEDFARQLDIDPSLISNIIEKHDWKDLINKLIEILPRSGNPNRYDM